MQNAPTPIKHSELFSSVESFLEFITPLPVDGPERVKCRPYSLPFWHPVSIKGQMAITSAEKLKSGEIKLTVAVAVNRSIPMEVCVQNGWLAYEEFIDSLEGFADYFVNGTIFGTEGGSLIVVDGPNKYTWTYIGPVKLTCDECSAKQEAAE